MFLILFDEFLNVLFVVGIFAALGEPYFNDFLLLVPEKILFEVVISVIILYSVIKS
jgi:hypothetical protein